MPTSVMETGSRQARQFYLVRVGGVNKL